MAMGSLNLGLEGANRVRGLDIDLERRRWWYGGQDGGRRGMYLVDLLLGGLDGDLHGG